MKSGSPSRTTATHKTQTKTQAWSSLVFHCCHSSFNPSEAPPWDSRPVSGAGVVHYQLLHRPRSVPTALGPAPLATEAFCYILPRRSAAVSTLPLTAAPPSARRRGRPHATFSAAPARPQQQPSQRPQCGAGRSKAAQPASISAKPVKRQGRRRPWDGRPRASGSCSFGDGDRTTPSPRGGPGGESFVSFLFCSTTGPQNFKKEQFPFPPGPKRARMAVHETPSPHSHPPLPSPVGSRVRFEDAMPYPALPAQLWSQVSVAPHTQTPLRDALPFESGPCAPLHCPTAGTSVTPLVPLVRSLGAWLEFPRPSCWLLRTIRLGCAIQFARRPPKFRGIRFTSVLNKDAPVLCAEVAVLLAKDAIEPVPPAEMKSGFYSPYFIVPKKGGGLRPILDLRILNQALHKLPFRMLTQRHIFQCIRPFDWFAAIDLKDTSSRSSLNTDCLSALCSKGEHTSTRPSPSGYPCHLESSPRS